jgi:hypothetical protein
MLRKNIRDNYDTKHLKAQVPDFALSQPGNVTPSKSTPTHFPLPSKCHPCVSSRTEDFARHQRSDCFLHFRSFETGIVSSRLLPAVIAAWRNPEHMEFQPRYGWSLLNAFTGVLKDRQKSSPQEAALQTIQLQRLLNPPDVIDVDSTAIAG